MLTTKKQLSKAFRRWYSDYVTNKENYRDIPSDTESKEFDQLCDEAADTLINYIEEQE